MSAETVMLLWTQEQVLPDGRHHICWPAAMHNLYTRISDINYQSFCKFLFPTHKP